LAGFLGSAGDAVVVFVDVMIDSTIEAEEREEDDDDDDDEVVVGSSNVFASDAIGGDFL
jgi:hypothetical protein